MISATQATKLAGLFGRAYAMANAAKLLGCKPAAKQRLACGVTSSLVAWNARYNEMISHLLTYLDGMGVTDPYNTPKTAPALRKAITKSGKDARKGWGIAYLHLFEKKVGVVETALKKIEPTVNLTDQTPPKKTGLPTKWLIGGAVAVVGLVLVLRKK